jgi:hypothetical protein
MNDSDLEKAAPWSFPLFRSRHVARMIVRGASRRPARKPLEVGEYGGYEPSPARVLPGRRASKQLQKIARFLGGFGPVRGRLGQKLRLQFITLKPKVELVGLYFGQHASLIGGFLGDHSAVPVEIDGSVSHIRSWSRRGLELGEQLEPKGLPQLPREQPADRETARHPAGVRIVYYFCWLPGLPFPKT